MRRGSGSGVAFCAPDLSFCRRFSVGFINLK